MGYLAAGEGGGAGWGTEDQVTSLYVELLIRFSLITCYIIFMHYINLLIYLLFSNIIMHKNHRNQDEIFLMVVEASLVFIFTQQCHFNFAQKANY